MQYFIRSFTAFIFFLFFGLTGTIQVFADTEYGVSSPMGPIVGVYALTGTIQPANSEIDHTVYIYATGASRGLFYDKINSILTGSIYSSQFGKIDVGNIKIGCSDLSVGPCPITKDPNGFATLSSIAIGDLTQTGASSVDTSNKKTVGLTFTNIGFSGSIIDLSNILLLPDPYHITGGYFGTGIYIASGSTNIDIKPDSYIQTGATLILTPMVGEGAAATKLYFAGNTTQFTGVDLSLAGDYAYTIIDQGGNSSVGVIKSIASMVNNGPAITDISGVNTVMHSYCNSNSGLSGTYKNVCPDEATMKSSNVNVDGMNMKANDSDLSQITLSIRDQYGNRIYRQEEYVTISVTGSLSGSGTIKSNIPTELRGGAGAPLTTFAQLTIPQPSWANMVNGNVNDADYASSSGSDLNIEIRSSAPGSAKVEWKVETKNDVLGSSNRGSIMSAISLPPTPDITFKGLIQNDSFIISPTGNILRNRESVFSHKYLISDSGSISTPHLEYIITTSSGEIVDRIRSATSDMCNVLNNTGATDPYALCGARNRDTSILSAEISNTLFGTNLPKTNSGTIDIGLTFATGAMTSTGTNTGHLIVMASYNIAGAGTIRYPLINQPFYTEELTGTIPLKILGQIGSSDLGTSMKSLDLLSSNLINTERDKIRKQAQMMRQNFQADGFRANTASASGQIYIVEGDIYIDGDIWPPVAQKPKVLIALKKADGTGGNIYIKDTVKDIAASLIADGSIFGWDGTSTVSPTIKNEGIDQLYIRGSIMSNNTIGGAGLSRCPRNTTTCTPTTAINYDFEKIRKLDTGAGGSTTSNAPDASTSFIIEHDPRLVQDSPLVLMRDLTR